MQQTWLCFLIILLCLYRPITYKIIYYMSNWYYLKKKSNDYINKKVVPTKKVITKLNWDIMIYFTDSTPGRP
jgi:hypothetical protein